MMKVLVRLRAGTRPAALAAVREIPGLEVALESESPVWLRSGLGESAELMKLRALPHEEIYQLGQEDSLTPLGKRLPTACLPKTLAWRALSAWLDIRLPVAALSGLIDSGHRVPLSLRRASGTPEAPNLLAVSMRDLKDYVSQAAAVRLRGLSFAVSGEGQAMVQGDALPAIGGEFFSLKEGLALPLGWQLAVPVGGGLVREALGLLDGEMAVLHHDRSFDRIRGDDFIALTRSAVKLTWERLRAGEETA